MALVSAHPNVRRLPRRGLRGRGSAVPSDTSRKVYRTARREFGSSRAERAATFLSHDLNKDTSVSILTTVGINKNPSPPS
jgi:hypothetical protein